MALDPKAQAALALHRFGFGPRAGSVAAIAADPRGALLADLDRPGAGLITDPDLPTSGAAARAAFAFQQAQRAAREAERAAQKSQAAPGADMLAGAETKPAEAPPTPPQPPARPNPDPGAPQQLYLGEAKARIDAALGAEIGFAERLVWFWSNHFCVSADKGNVRQICGAYEREAIRAHALGRFGDMLLAVESHPAMLLYLDNARSIGPELGRRPSPEARPQREPRARDPRTAYARRALGLHPGRRHPLRQCDHRLDRASRCATTRCMAASSPSIRACTSPAPRRCSARAIRIPGSSRAARCSPMLARASGDRQASGHQAGAPFRCRRAAAGAGRAARQVAFSTAEGDLKEVAKALVGAPEAWDAPRSKLKRPGEWIVGALRATGVTPPDIRPVMQAHNLLGEPLWRPTAPKGFADDSAAWLDGLAQRLDVANALARRVAGLVDPIDVFDVALGPLASAETRQTDRARREPAAGAWRCC